MRFCMKHLVSRMLKKSLFSPAQPQRAETRLSPGIVLCSSKSSTYLRGWASGYDSPAALLDEHFEHPLGGYSSCPRRSGHQIATVPIWFFCGLICLISALGFWDFGLVWADEGPRLGPRTLVVALDGTGDYTSLQEAVD